MQIFNILKRRLTSVNVFLVNAVLVLVNRY